MPETSKMDRNLALEAVRVTEAAALSASRLMGRGDEKAADQAAVDAMRRELNKLPIDGTIVIGEGERDEAPMLFIGETVGNKHGPRVDIAVDPLEGTTLCAKNMPGAIATMAMAVRPTYSCVVKAAASTGVVTRPGRGTRMNWVSANCTRTAPASSRCSTRVVKPCFIALSRWQVDPAHGAMD